MTGSLLLESLTPIAPPTWLPSALLAGSPEAPKLTGVNLLYKFSDRDGGWALGNIRAPNADSSILVDIENEEGLSGKSVANFTVEYTDGCELTQLFTLDQYATSEDAEEGSWVLLYSKSTKATPARRTPALTLTPATGEEGSGRRLSLMGPPPAPKGLTRELQHRRSQLIEELRALDAKAVDE